MPIIDKLYEMCHKKVISRKEDERFCKESHKMVQPCGKMFKTTTHDVILAGAQLMHNDGFTIACFGNTSKEFM